MSAYRLLGWGDAPQLVEVEVPRPGPGEVVVAVEACGLCHSDLAMMAMPQTVGDQLGWAMPFTLGHESAGVVAAVGAGVRAVREGDRVALASPTSCGACRHCADGHESACDQGMVGRGYGRDGSLAEQVLVASARDLFPIGELPAAVAAPLTDAGATSFHAVARVLARLPDDGTAVVIGVGGLGAFVVQILRACSPARVVAIDQDPVRREVARALGAHEVLEGVDAGTPGALRGLLGREGANVAIDLVGTDETIACGLGSLAARGSFGLVGAAGGTLRRPWYGTLPRDGEAFTFQGSDRADAHGVLELARDGRLRVDVVPYALADVDAAYQALHTGGLAGRVVVAPG